MNGWFINQHSPCHPNNTGCHPNNTGVNLRPARRGALIADKYNSNNFKLLV